MSTLDNLSTAVTWQWLLGAIGAIVLGIVGNLLTPLVKSLWEKILVFLRHSQYAQVRQQIKVVQFKIDELNRRKNGSDRDLFLYLYKWSLAIFAVFAMGAACAFIALAATDVTETTRQRLMLVSLGCLLGTTIMSALILLESQDLTERGLQKRVAKLEARRAALLVRLPAGVSDVTGRD